MLAQGALNPGKNATCVGIRRSESSAGLGSTYVHPRAVACAEMYALYAVTVVVSFTSSAGWIVCGSLHVSVPPAAINAPPSGKGTSTESPRGGAQVTSTTCAGEIPVGSTCDVTVAYDPTRLQSPTGLAYDTLDLAVASDAGQVHDFVQSYTIVLTPANTTDGDGN